MRNESRGPPGTKIVQKSKEVRPKVTFLLILLIWGAIWGPKRLPKLTKNAAKMLSKSSCLLETLFYRFKSLLGTESGPQIDEKLFLKNL